MVLAVLVLLLGGGVIALVRTKKDARTSATDDFAVPRATLAGTTTSDGATWTVDGGTFATRDGSAVIVPSGSSTDRVTATVDIGHPTTVVTTEIKASATGAGITFRYVDSRNYWSLVAAPGYGTWNLNKTVDGVTQFVTNTGRSFSSQATPITVNVQGLSITVVVGKVSKTIADGALTEGTSAGLIGPANDGSSQWSSFSVISAG